MIVFFISPPVPRIMRGIAITWCPLFVRVVHKHLHFNLLLWNHWANWNQIWKECSLEGPLPIFFVDQKYTIKFVCGFLRALQFPLPIKLIATIINWNISGIKNHNPNPLNTQTLLTIQHKGKVVFDSSNTISRLISKIFYHADRK